jgi:hypothetical protein
MHGLPHMDHIIIKVKNILFWNDESNKRYAKIGQSKDNVEIYQI